MKEEKLKQIYDSGNLKLCYKMMEAEGIDYLDIDFDFDFDFERCSIEMETRDGTVLCVFSDYDGKRQGEDSEELYETSIFDNDVLYDVPKSRYLSLLNNTNLCYLEKYISKDNDNHYCFGYIPKHEILKLIFAKKKE